MKIFTPFYDSMILNGFRIYQIVENNTDLVITQVCKERI